jgi:acylphosphatase
MKNGGEIQEIRAHVIVRGGVQGVFYRYTAREVAHSLGVVGWVRNRPDGMVEAVFEGKRDRVEKIIEWCRKGPPGAYVQGVDVHWEEYLGEFEHFAISY